MSKLRVVYMGTPEFAVKPLEVLLNAGVNIVGVVTNPDKPAGRGRKTQESAVKKFAQTKQLPILQPHKFRDPCFLKELEALQADLQVVVAFKMLPEVVWNMPRFGTLNLHASLLPQYRGAAPINHAIINGEKETGVSTFLLQHEIDTGSIIHQEKVVIAEKDTVGTVYEKLMQTGSELLLKTVNAIEDNNYTRIPQSELIEKGEVLKKAPKIFKEDCKINWEEGVEKVYNFIRGLSPYPTAWSILKREDGAETLFKIYFGEKEYAKHSSKSGQVLSDGKSFMKVAVKDGYIHLTQLQQAGKKVLAVSDFLRGVQNPDACSFI